LEKETVVIKRGHGHDWHRARDWHRDRFERRVYMGRHTDRSQVRINVGHDRY
jgi:hypothetical protein